jgi:hypothetical protein
MNITITKVLKDDVTVSGQPLKREYVENVMLPLLMAQCGTVKGHQFEIVKAFDEAGLSLQAIPDVARDYREYKRAKATERARLQAEADAHAERCRVHTPREIAQAKADKEERAAAHRAHAQKILAARSRNNGW